jgi:Peptidase propeptide and YPEB domain
MKPVLAVVIVMALTTSHAALASDHCRRPMSQWQSREAVTAHVQQLGIRADRLKIDDGCYEVRGRDSDGNRIELKLDPATLDPLEMEIRFRPGANIARYLPAAR